MQTKHLLFITILLIATILTKSYAQDNTQTGLPEGAIARLGKGGINIMRFSPDGTRLAVGTDIGVWLYNVQTGKETYIPRIIASQSQPLQDVLDREEPIEFTEGAGQVNTLAFSPDGKMIASGSKDKTVQLWDIEKRKNLLLWKHMKDGLLFWHSQQMGKHLQVGAMTAQYCYGIGKKFQQSVRQDRNDPVKLDINLQD